MRTHRGAIAVALVAFAGSISVPFTAQAATGTPTFYVNNKVACSDSTASSAATPYCTIQAAVNAATSPGDTVLVATGVYAPFTVTASGTPDAPITIESSDVSARPSLTPVSVTPRSVIPAVTVQSASYEDIQGFILSQDYAASDVQVADSSHVALNSNTIRQYVMTTAPAVSVGSGSSYVTISRNVISAHSPAGAIVTQGGTGDVITTDEVSGSTYGPGISLSQTTGSDVTSNNVTRSCGEGIEITDGSTSVSIENNVATVLTTAAAGCAVPADAADEILVDSTSTSGTTLDYNNVNPLASSTDSDGFGFYSWAGTVYTSASAFSTATGQGEHDLSTYGASTINDANSDAPGELTADIYGNPWVNDPEVPDTGAGAYAYYDRGAIATEDPITVTAASNWPTMMPADNTGTFTAQVADGWSANTIMSCIYNFGDGTAAVTITPTDGVCTATHSYSAAGSYSGTLTVTVSDG